MKKGILCICIVLLTFCCSCGDKKLQYITTLQYHANNSSFIKDSFYSYDDNHDFSLESKALIENIESDTMELTLHLVGLGLEEDENHIISNLKFEVSCEDGYLLKSEIKDKKNEINNFKDSTTKFNYTFENKNKLSEQQMPVIINIKSKDIKNAKITIKWTYDLEVYGEKLKNCTISDTVHIIE